MDNIKRVLLTQAAEDLINKLKISHGELMFHQSGGCCDGSQPMCFTKGDFIVGSSDVCLGTVDGCDFWMSKDQFMYWQNTQLIIDVTEGRGSSFSIEIPLGFRFLTKSRMFNEEEIRNLEALRFNE